VASALALLSAVAACSSSGLPDPEAPQPAAKKTIEPPPEPVANRPYEPVMPLEPLPVAAPPPPEPDPNAPADVASPPADAAQTSSGLISKVLQPGTGNEHPGPEDIVAVHFTGWMTNGIKFESSAERGQAAEYTLGKVIPGWREGLQLMVAGEKRRFWVPGRLAYGDSPRTFGRPYGTLVYDIELVSFRRPPAPPEVPDDLTAPPAGAHRTPSGLVYQVLRKGTGKVHPKPRSVVEVHYSGWTTDGKMFDSSVVRGETSTFPLNGVIKGWTEGLQLMVVGEKARFWIPSKLAYGDTPRGGSPAGPLVFDVELISIK
jgi:peptidylprolyl isomerase